VHKSTFLLFLEVHKSPFWWISVDLSAQPLVDFGGFIGPFLGAVFEVHF
jgi:hypothetical protein